MNKETYKQNLLTNYYKAGDDHIRHGMNWYRDAHFQCKREAERLRIPLYLFVAVVSALSPQKKWEKNIDDAISYITGKGKDSIFATSVMKQKCKDILDLHGYVYDRSGKISIYKPQAIRKILKGRKVVSFFNNILYPHIAMTVTVDRWAIRSVGLDKGLTDKRYKEIEEVHQEVAKEVGILPHQVQSITWLVVRGIE